MSVFLTLMQSDMDELLEWPFTKRVRVTVIVTSYVLVIGHSLVIGHWSVDTFTKRVRVTLLDQSDDDAESQRRHVTHVIDTNYDLDDCMSLRVGG